MKSDEQKVIEGYAVQLSDLVASAMAQLWEGGSRLAEYPNDDTFERKLQQINEKVWQLRWQIGADAGEVVLDPARENADVADAKANKPEASQ